MLELGKSEHEQVRSVGVGGKSGGKGCSRRFVRKSGVAGAGGKSGFGGLGVGGQGVSEFGGLGVVGRNIVRFDDGKGILDHDMPIHTNIDDATERLMMRLRLNRSADHVKLALCENLSDVRTGRALLGGEHKTRVTTLLCTLLLAALAPTCVAVCWLCVAY